MNPAEMLARVGGAATRAELVACGVTQRSLASAVAEGSIARVRRGTYAHPDASELSVARVAWRCEPTCITAAREFGLPVASTDHRLHMALDPSRSSAPRNAWPPRRIVVHMPARVPFPPTLAVDVIDSAARCVTALEQLDMVDAALNAGLMTEGDFKRLSYTPRSRVRWLAEHCEARSQSLLETRARVALRGAGLRVEPQVAVPGVGRVDFLVEDRLVVETDGRGTHALAAAFDVDRRRDRASLIAGLPVMRFGYTDVMGDIDGVVSQVRAALRRVAA